ncbi:PhoPQ-activated protein PqaA family protein [Citrobacter portucalensis]|uniref:PhoPQ-activated protein PqaA family protein n=1 Tax=Citrobacter portucalensis TaxID=1639133 RepID=UPI00226B64E8|nr:PhoPQ-activated protein PqaA family protein [Citrobacter portucalensis]MCX8985937.1 PhoPQ-activated protein PqaA family protein [Citrobacter portucalensis]
MTGENGCKIYQCDYLCNSAVYLACLALSSPREKYKTTNSLAALPHDYYLLEKKQLPGVMLRRYNLNSQAWSPQDVVSPERWQNGVDFYLPDFAIEKNALVVINNGSNSNGSDSPVAPTNFSE